MRQKTGNLPVLIAHQSKQCQFSGKFPRVLESYRTNCIALLLYFA
jgi:hypothetical protein